MKPFKDRKDAAMKLARHLGGLKGQDPLVLAVPCGGVPLGRELARELAGTLDLMLVRRVAVPTEGGRTVGALNEEGRFFFKPGPGDEPPSPNELNRAIAREYRHLRECRLQYTPGREPCSVDGRLVLLVDDGVVTGSTMEAALETLHLLEPGKIIVATPVAPPRVAHRLKEMAARVVVLHPADNVEYLQDYYEDFSEVSPVAVPALLGESFSN